MEYKIQTLNITGDKTTRPVIHFTVKPGIHEIIHNQAMEAIDGHIKALNLSMNGSRITIRDAVVADTFRNEEENYIYEIREYSSLRIE